MLRPPQPTTWERADSITVFTEVISKVYRVWDFTESATKKKKVDFSHKEKQLSPVPLFASHLHNSIKQSPRTLQRLAEQYQMQRRFNLQICETSKFRTLCKT